MSFLPLFSISETTFLTLDRRTAVRGVRVVGQEILRVLLWVPRGVQSVEDIARTHRRQPKALVMAYFFVLWVDRFW